MFTVTIPLKNLQALHQSPAAQRVFGNMTQTEESAALSKNGDWGLMSFNQPWSGDWAQYLAYTIMVGQVKKDWENHQAHCVVSLMKEAPTDADIMAFMMGVSIITTECGVDLVLVSSDRMSPGFVSTNIVRVDDTLCTSSLQYTNLEGRPVFRLRGLSALTGQDIACFVSGPNILTGAPLNFLMGIAKYMLQNKTSFVDGGSIGSPDGSQKIKTLLMKDPQSGIDVCLFDVQPA